MGVGAAERLVAHSAGVHDALHHGGDGTTFVQVQDLLRSNLAQLWENGESGLVSKFLRNEHTGTYEVLVWLGWGTISELTPLMEEVEEWARGYEEVRRVTLVGRLGWMRSPLVKTLGYTARYVMYEKEL